MATNMGLAVTRTTDVATEVWLSDSIQRSKAESVGSDDQGWCLSETNKDSGEGDGYHSQC